MRISEDNPGDKPCLFSIKEHQAPSLAHVGSKKRRGFRFARLDVVMGKLEAG